MNKYTEKTISTIHGFLKQFGFSKKSKLSFSRKQAPKREESFSISIRKGRAPYNNYDYISINVGIYYPEVKKMEKELISNFLNSYPIIGGAVSLYTKSQKYEEYPVFDEASSDYAYKGIIQEIKEGGFVLFNTFPDLNSILLGISNKHEWLKDYFLNLDTRTKITIASMMVIEHGKEQAIEWIKE